MASLIIGTAAVAAIPAMKTAESEKFRKKVNVLKAEGKFEYIAVGEVKYKYTRPLRFKKNGNVLNDPIYSSLAQMKQNIEGNGDNRILAVVRKPNGAVEFVLLKRPSDSKCYYRKNPLDSCSIDTNLKTNQGGIVESSGLRVIKKDSNTFQIECTNFRPLQSHRKVFVIQVKNTKRTPMANGRLSGIALCEVLNYLAKEGYVPKDFPSISSRDSAIKNEKENNTFSSSVYSSSSSSSSSSIPYTVNTNVSENSVTLSTYDEDDDVTTANSENGVVDPLPVLDNVNSFVSSSTEAVTSQHDELDHVITIAIATATATATATEYDDEVVHVDMATLVE